MRVIHSVNKPFKVGDEVRTRCGKSASINSVGVGAAHLIDEAGNEFYASTHREAITCRKCINLNTVGTIHDKQKRTPNTAQRAVRRYIPTCRARPICRPGRRLREFPQSKPIHRYAR